MRFFFSSLVLYFFLLLLCRACLGGEVKEVLSSIEASSATAESKASAFIEALKPSNLANVGQNLMKNIPLPHQGRGRCKGSEFAASALLRDNKCASQIFQSPNPLPARLPTKLPGQLIIFVSTSMPKASLQELGAQVSKAGGKLVLRGLVGNSFRETQSTIKDLAIVADIDPVKFEEFDVRQVPTFILYEGSFETGIRQDRLVGNISLKACLEQFAASGELKKEARALYEALERGQG